VSVAVRDIRSQVPQAWTIWKGLDQLTGDARVRLNPDTLDLTAGDRTLTPSRAPTEASAADRAALKVGPGDAPNQTAAFWATVRRRLNAGSP
jgi:hypothetical protein